MSIYKINSKVYDNSEHNMNKDIASTIQNNLIDRTNVSFDKKLIADLLSQNKTENQIEEFLYTKYMDAYVNSIEIVNGETPKYGKSITRDSKILVLSIVKNCSSSFGLIKKFIEDLQHKVTKCCFYYYTNNNLDRTEKLLSNWSSKNKNVSGHVDSDENVSTILDNGNIGNRLIRFADYREKCLRMAIDHFGKDFDYIIIFDSDLSQQIPVENVIKSLSIQDNWSMLCGNMRYQNSPYHYDQLALRFIGQSTDISTIYPNFNKYYGRSPHWLNKLFIMHNLIEVDSAFGGICILKFDEIYDLTNRYKKIYDVENYPDGTCEHICLANKLKNKKFIDANITYSNHSSIENSLVPSSKIFIPRDAGFFSVFNFLVGSLTRGLRLYPYFNKEIFMTLHGTNAHFSYWTNRDNCWFDYFEPLKFYGDDKIHNTIKKYDIKNTNFTVGEIAPKEFTHPASSESIMNDSINFPRWRRYVHSIYKEYIKFHDDILSDTNKFWEENIKTDMCIGVHYRHPSHSCESGAVYLKQYFEKIDSIIQKHKNISIFLASDNMFGILAFKDRYADRLKYIKDIDRLEMDNILSWAYELAKGKRADVVGMIEGKGFELQHIAAASNTGSKKMTVDLLKEVICLSKCNYLIHTTSNIPLSISYMNPDIEMIFVKGNR